MANSWGGLTVPGEAILCRDHNQARAVSIPTLGKRSIFHQDALAAGQLSYGLYIVFPPLGGLQIVVRDVIKANLVGNKRLVKPRSLKLQAQKFVEIRILMKFRQSRPPHRPVTPYQSAPVG
jgi:hypothetical protein